MKLNTQQVLKDLEGNTLTEPVIGLDGKQIFEDGIPKTKEVTVWTVARNCLTLSLAGDNPDGAEKFKRGELALRMLQNSPEVEMTSDEQVLLKRLCGLAYGTLVVFAFWNLIEGK